MSGKLKRRFRKRKTTGLDKHKRPPKGKPGQKTHATVPVRHYNHTFDMQELMESDPDYLEDMMQDNESALKEMNENFSYAPYNELMHALPRCRELLGTDDVQVMMNNVPCDYMDEEKYKDRAIKCVGMNGAPFIYDYRLHVADSWGPGVGLTLYQTRQDNLRYVLLQMRQPGGGHERLWIIPQRKVYRFMRYTHRQNKLCVKDMKPPILESGMLKKIVDQSINFLINKDRVEEYGVKVRRGILMAGSPGNGKTMVCRWLRKLCNDNDIEMGIVTSAQIETAAADGSLQNLFSRNPVLFFDDIDISYLSRSSGKGSIACAILTAMDGVEESDHVVRIFTTNEHIGDLDEAFIRPGRIDCRFVINKPTKEMKSQLVKERWHKEIVEYLEKDGNMDKLMEYAKDYSFADLDAVKGFLVTEKLMGSGVFDLEKAIENFNQGREGTPDNGKHMGFVNR